MNRLRQRQVEAVARAIDYIPGHLRPLVECDIFCADPIFAGLHAFESAHEEGLPGRSYRDTAHVAYPWHGRDSRTTLVAPMPISVEVALHELGHVLHGALAERAGWQAVPRLEPVTSYAGLSIHEAFGFFPPRQIEAEPYWLRWSRDNDEFFNRIGLA